MKRALITGLALASVAASLAAEVNPLDALRLEDLSATRERPLFTPARRPPPPPKTSAPPATEPAEVEDKPVALGPPPFDLVGAVVGKRIAFALLRDRATSKVVRVRSGDDAAGWRVGKIGPRTIALARDGRTELLALAAPRAAAVGPELAGDPAPPGVLARPPASEATRELVKSRRDR
jgi:hypothetical protein